MQHNIRKKIKMQNKEKIKNKILAFVKKIPKGKVTTYKILAEKLGIKNYRLIGQILKKNYNKDIPCHRVVCSNGFIGGYHGKRYNEKIKFLKREGIKIKNYKIIKFKEVLFKF